MENDYYRCPYCGSYEVMEVLEVDTDEIFYCANCNGLW